MEIEYILKLKGKEIRLNKEELQQLKEQLLDDDSKVEYIPVYIKEYPTYPTYPIYPTYPAYPITTYYVSGGCDGI